MCQCGVYVCVHVLRVCVSVVSLCQCTCVSVCVCGTWNGAYSPVIISMNSEKSEKKKKQ